MLNAAEMAYELADIREEMRGTLPEHVRILRYSGDDKSNVEGVKEQYPADAEWIPGSLAATGLTDSETIIASKFQDRTTYVVNLPAGTALRNEDRLRFETRDGLAISPFRTFDVVYVPDDSGEWLRRVLAIEIK